MGIMLRPVQHDNAKSDVFIRGGNLLKQLAHQLCRPSGVQALRKLIGGKPEQAHLVAFNVPAAPQRGQQRTGQGVLAVARRAGKYRAPKRGKPKGRRVRQGGHPGQWTAPDKAVGQLVQCGVLLRRDLYQFLQPLEHIRFIHGVLPPAELTEHSSASRTH